MTPDELPHLIAQGEGQRLERKRSLAELEMVNIIVHNTDPPLYPQVEYDEPFKC